ncbi:response regulator transcription factor [Laedolimicola sp.]|uniref:response regulator transcription factor n=1 Tax=Laedolimicola sp. TaxID=2981663 RepID=UPI003F81AB2D
MYSVFLADDEIWIVMGLKKLIEKSGEPFRVVGEANNGVTALEEIRRLRPDVVISDIRMPGLDGLKLLEELNLQTPGTKLVFVSGYAEFEYARKALQMGAVDYLLKPVEQEQLTEVLRRLGGQVEKNGQSRAEKPENLPPSILQQIVEEIQSSYTENITLTGLAGKYSLSTGYLSSLLKEELGLPFSDYLTSKRIQKAKELLADETLSVEAVAEHVGYRDYFYFTKVFKKNAGMSPSKYRTEVLGRK